MLILNFLFSLALAQEGSSNFTLKDSNSKQLEYNFEIELSMESVKTKLQDQRVKKQPSIQNFSVGSKIKFNRDLSFLVELLGEQNQEDTDVYFGEIYGKYKLPYYNNLAIKIGNMYYTYGLLVGKEALLSRRPDYYSDLLVTRRGIDLGGSINWQATEKLPLFVNYSIFSGSTLRAGDNQTQTAESQPQVISLSYEPSFLTTQLTYINRKYSNGPAFTSYGLSVEAAPVEIIWKDLSLQPMAEYWNLMYSRIDGDEQEGQAFLVGNKTTLFGLFHRWIFSNERWISSSVSSTDVTTVFQLHGLGYEFNKYFHFEYQRIMSKESQASLNLNTVNESVYRVYFKL